jgi:hypothetical protein
VPFEITRRAFVLFDGAVDLRPGQEWHSDPIPLMEGDELTLRCRSASRLYAGLFDRATHDRVITAPNGQRRAFPFRFGSDQVFIERSYPISASTDYIAVVRRGVYSREGPAQIRIVRTMGRNG